LSLVPGRIEGTVVSITAEGNLVTDISADQLADAPTDERVLIDCDGHETNGLFPPDHGQPEATFLALIGAGGALELTIVGLSASAMLGVRGGEKVVVTW
jgi:S-adenosylmethionine hydrolase